MFKGFEVHNPMKTFITTQYACLNESLTSI